ncbi:MAG: hypothetical protein EXR63_00880 [Dehalococcoidia bacterium]|nr:hypothetical protein [Dehalococcoidia bacterium]
MKLWAEPRTKWIMGIEPNPPDLTHAECTRDQEEHLRSRVARLPLTAVVRHYTVALQARELIPHGLLTRGELLSERWHVHATGLLAYDLDDAITRRRQTAWQELGLIFPSELGSVWNVRNFYRDYRRVVARSGVARPETVSFHCLRHTAATQWLRSGADIHSVSRRLGHASAAFSMDKYGHMLEGMQRTAAEALDHLLA